MGGRGGNGGQGPNKTAKSQQGHDILMFLRGYVFGGFDTARWRVEERRRGRGATAAVQGGLKVGGEYIYIYIPAGKVLQADREQQSSAVGPRARTDFFF